MLIFAWADFVNMHHFSLRGNQRDDEWQRMGDPSDATMIFPGPDFVKCAGMLRLFSTSCESKFADKSKMSQRIQAGVSLGQKITAPHARQA